MQGGHLLRSKETNDLLSPYLLQHSAVSPDTPELTQAMKGWSPTLAAAAHAAAAVAAAAASAAAATEGLHIEQQQQQ